MSRSTSTAAIVVVFSVGMPWSRTVTQQGRPGSIEQLPLTVEEVLTLVEADVSTPSAAAVAGELVSSLEDNVDGLR